ncbi:MAG: 4-hydroxy-tetrahydrodipicolinate synthase [Deltaproteobacteria bacterium RBG_13_61_14]|nr:MAG: 4-hydroxy-tetrahydrodipicolinate synthase [Deltaproteobacteria bacterium RBG_13_61_14]
MQFSGVWLPLITPFSDGAVDYKSLARLIEHYIAQGIAGLVPLATTGEVPTIADDEYVAVLEKTLEIINGRLPVIAGVSGNDTRRVAAKMKLLSNYPLAGALIPCPYYNRPDQRGIYEHFKAVAGASPLTILVYNIPYRTGRNIENKTIHQLASIPTVRGLKDSCGDIKQSMELLLHPPGNFSILTGEDILYFDTLCLGGDGGILASAHLATDKFVSMYDAVKANDTAQARTLWKVLSPLIPHLFEEPNPAPIKYCLKKLGMMHSDEVRLPLTPISDGLRVKLDLLLKGLERV